MAVSNVNTSDPRVKRTRQMLYNAFMSLLREKGFESVTVQDISQRSTVNRATFYAHYENKFDLAEDLVRQQFHERLRESVPLDSPVTEATLEALFSSVLSFIGDVYGTCRLDRQFGALMEGALYEAMHEFALEWLSSSKSMMPQGQAGITACVMSAAIIGVGVKSSTLEARLPEAEFARQVAGVLGRGMIQGVNGGPYANGH